MRPSFHLFLLRRWEARRQAAWALLDGRLTFRQAAARFRDIDAELPYEARGRRPPQYSEEEWPYRQVISYVRADDPPGGTRAGGGVGCPAGGGDARAPAAGRPPRPAPVARRQGAGRRPSHRT